ncbi:MAG: MBL fold metallo-hydrolase [Tyzzerella sp.]|nr:MBL fold metallo-hydrolase [Tyzzerella sp.]
MKIEKFVLGAMSTNTYLVENKDTKELVIVDPAACPDYMVSHVKSNGYEPKAILLTHGHFDHIMGIDKWVKEFDVPVYAYADEKEVLADSGLNLSCMLGVSYTFNKVKELQDGDVLDLVGFSFKVIHTPGHTKGGCCYYEAAEGVLFSGDTLFHQSVGRSDFPTGSMATLVRSIKEKLFCLPDDVMVYPGHNSLTCIADEKMYNPFV